MTATHQPMTDEDRKALVVEYLKAFDRAGVTTDGGSILDLFADDAQVYFPKWGIANGKDEIGKLFDQGYPEMPPIIQVGDPTRLIIKVPVSPQDYRVLKEDLPAKGGQLEATIYVKGRSDRQFHGKLRRVPEQNATSLPIQLTQRGGGPLAVKPSEDPNLLVPLAQTYLVEVELTDPDAAVKPGQLAVVKIHAKWRSGAWWVKRALSNAMDLGLY
jgi:putative peptide zinc metalloprotease protein